MGPFTSVGPFTFMGPFICMGNFRLCVAFYTYRPVITTRGPLASVRPPVGGKGGWFVPALLSVLYSRLMCLQVQ